MLLQKFVKTKRINTSLLIITILASLLIFPQKTYAETISPSLTEDTLVSGESSKHSLEFINDNDYDIFITPELYKYYPQSEYVLDLEPYEEIVDIGNDYIKIPANTSSEIDFRIKAPESLDPGTYYNLMVFEPIGKEKEDSTIGANQAISHLIKLNIIDNPNILKHPASELVFFQNTFLQKSKLYNFSPTFFL